MAGSDQLFLQNLLNILDSYAGKGPAVDYYKGTLTAAIHAACSPEHNLVIKVILPQIIPYDLYYFPVTP